MTEQERADLARRAAAIVHPPTPDAWLELPTAWHSGYEDGFLGLPEVAAVVSVKHSEAEIWSSYSDGWARGVADAQKGAN